MKIGSKEKSLILVVLAIAIVAVVYMYVFQAFNQKTDALKLENASLETSINHLRELENNRIFYNSEIQRFAEENQVIMDKYAASMKLEDYILLLTEVENDADMFITRASLTPESIVSVEFPTLSGADVNVVNLEQQEVTVVKDDGSTETISNPAGVFLSKRQLNLETELSYTSMKDFITKLLENENVMSLENIALTYNDSNGTLSGSFVVNSYSMYGNGKVYEEPAINGVRTGIKSIFGTYVPASSQSDAEAAAE